jgi:iron complex transport system substrate-binding protein
MTAPARARGLVRTVPALALGLVLAACGTTGASPSAGGTTAGQSMAPEVPETRMVTDIYGEPIEVPGDPQRIVAIHDVNGGEQILSLGYEVVGFPTRDGEFDSELTSVYDLEGVREVGDVYAPNIEAILALEPDLIVGEGYDGQGQDQFMDDGIHEQLESIAPVVYIDAFRPVDEIMADFAELLGPRAQAEYERQRDAYDTELAAVQAELGDTEGLSVAVVGMRADDVVEAYGPETLVPSVIISSLGIEQPPITEDAEEEGGYLSLSLERIPDVSADVILLDKGVGQYGGDYTDNALWRALPAVQAGQVHEWGAEWYGATYHRYSLALAEIGPVVIAADRDVVE